MLIAIEVSVGLPSSSPAVKVIVSASTLKVVPPTKDTRKTRSMKSLPVLVSRTRKDVLFQVIVESEACINIVPSQGEKFLFLHCLQR